MYPQADAQVIVDPVGPENPPEGDESENESRKKLSGKVVRGGSCNTGAGGARSAARNAKAPDTKSTNDPYGIRIVLVPEE